MGHRFGQGLERSQPDQQEHYEEEDDSSPAATLDVDDNESGNKAQNGSPRPGHENAQYQQGCDGSVQAAGGDGTPDA